MGQIGGFLKHGRLEHAVRPATERVRDWDEIAAMPDEAARREQAGRCMACGVAFCQAGIAFGGARHVTGCPLHNLIPEWNDLVWRGLWKEAYERLSMTNPFPEITGRVCPALCEKACNLGLHDEPTTVRDNERAIADKAFELGLVEPPAPRGGLGGKTVAVVGSGPAGLACSWELARRGHTVTVYERADRAGGLLTYGIPTMKLPKEIVGRRVDLLERAGVRFELGTAADSRICGAFDAVVVAVGATKPRALDVPGSGSAGVVAALDYLEAAVRAVLAGDPDSSAISARGLDVAVVGGGDTGTDCLATALRQGAASVTQLQYHPAPPEHRAAGDRWPLWPNVLVQDYGHEEAAALQGTDPRLWSTDTLEVLADGSGRARALKVCKVEWSSGRPLPVAGTEREIPAQLVLVARGFAGPEEDAFGALGIAMTGGERSLPVCVGAGGGRGDGGAFAVAGRSGFFVCGDCRRGASLVVNAIDEGVRCAAAVDRWLAGR